jgi:uncharacterized protein (TIGR02646 family)
MRTMIRQTVFDKFDGHCAYCGKEITLKEMQVEHFIPRNMGGTNNFVNLFPSCRRCNFYKHTLMLGEFRKLIQTLKNRVSNQFIVKIAIDYGILKLNEWDGLFYFEKVLQKKLTDDDVLTLWRNEMANAISKEEVQK